MEADELGESIFISSQGSGKGVILKIRKHRRVQVQERALKCQTFGSQKAEFRLKVPELHAVHLHGKLVQIIMELPSVNLMTLFMAMSETGRTLAAFAVIHTSLTA